MPSRSFSAVTFSVAAFLLWIGHFLFVYVFTALACERGSAQHEVLGLNIVYVALGLATAVAFVGLVVVALTALRAARVPRQHTWNASAFLQWISLSACVLASIAIALNALPGVVVETICWS